MESARSLPDTQLLYIFDPLCGWCYGMSPVMQRLAEEYADRVPVAVLSGGMFTGDEVGPIRDAWGYIGQALEQVEAVTGVQFGESFRQLGAAGGYLNDSEPPSRALQVFKQLDPLGRDTAFAHALQQAHFGDGRDLNDFATYEPLIQSFGLDVAEFKRWWDSDAARQATRHEFDVVQRMGVQGFPTLIFAHGQQGYVLARGYQPYEQIKAGLEQLLLDTQSAAG
ncbi:DsbA family protein [Hymenobacter busanensis]|uniref:DsbA family protein n=1 Tax=Hymenobacter busanensis TaxID=2607656 RepID=A0A7L5A0Z5_9BACT|nr:DsbA family protein [Hymenobacter busanensis]KAA9338385.1 DsbA family protein [Hymenobacter busanensis]QHJ09188.1 DsbA family protein [Hymenobacter busanensis]